MTRTEILEAARLCFCGEQVCGASKDEFTTIGLLWAVYLRAAHPGLAKVMPVNGITAKDAATMMCLLKVACIATSDKDSNFSDLAGFAAYAGEIAGRG